MDVLTVWTIYRNPRDYPGRWVLRAFDVSVEGTKARSECVVAQTLEEVRIALPPGRVPLGRANGDDPAVYECWV